MKKRNRIADAIPFLFSERQYRCNNRMRTYIRMARGQYKYDWSVIRRYYEEGHGYLECREKFGFAKDTWIKAIRRGHIVVKPREWSIEKVLQASRSRYTVKRRLLAAGILKNACDECGISEWRGRPLAIQIDHVNGVRDDHRLENLRMLCPNCHSQTETYAARNRTLKKRLREQAGLENDGAFSA